MNKKAFEQFLTHKEKGVITFEKLSDDKLKVSFYAEEKFLVTYVIETDVTKCVFECYYDADSIRAAIDATKSKNNFYLNMEQLIEEITPAKTVKKDENGNVVIPNLKPITKKVKCFKTVIQRHSYSHALQEIFKETFINDKSEFIKMMKHSKIECGTLHSFLNEMAIYTDNNQLIFRGASPFCFLKLKWNVDKDSYLDCIILDTDQIQHLFKFLNYKELKNITIVVNKKIIYFIDEENGDEINFFYEKNPYFKNWDIEKVLEDKTDICDVQFRFAKKKQYLLKTDAHVKVLNNDKTLDDVYDMNIGCMDSFALTLNELELNPFHHATITKNEKVYPIVYKQEEGYTLIIM